MSTLDTVLSIKVFGVDFINVAASLFIILITLVFRGIILKAVFASLRKMTSKSHFLWDTGLVRAANKPMGFLVLWVGLYFSAACLMSTFFTGRVFDIFKLGILVIGFWFLIRLTDAFGAVLEESYKSNGKGMSAFVPLLRKTSRVFVFLVAILAVVTHLGYEIGPLLATLGLGGAALAFASKDTIANLYGSLALALDRPFKVGDRINVGSTDGFVEEIGLRSTKVRTLTKTLVSIPNNTVANDNIENISEMTLRRVKQTIGLTYSTKPDQMRAIVAKFKDIIMSDEGTDKNFHAVAFTEFNNSSLDILVCYYTNTLVWVEHIDIQQRINLKMMDAVEEMGLSMAFPTRTLHLEPGDSPLLVSKDK